MEPTLTLLFGVIALILFVLDAVNVRPLQSWGLASLVLAIIL